MATINAIKGEKIQINYMSNDTFDTSVTITDDGTAEDLSGKII